MKITFDTKTTDIKEAIPAIRAVLDRWEMGVPQNKLYGRDGEKIGTAKVSAK